MVAAKNWVKGLFRGGKKAAKEVVCFVAGTLVRTDTGLRPIEEISVGDLVWSRDDASGREEWKPVVQTFETPAQAVLNLRLVAADGEEQQLLVTGEHPFMTASGWLAARKLSPGTSVWARDGRARVSSLTEMTERRTVYNFEVQDFHTYFVGEAGVWVHNLCKYLRRKLNRIEGLASIPGNSGIRTAISGRQAMQMGKAFVGKGFTISRGRNGEAWLISKNGKRLFRAPRPKSSPFARTGKQANFHVRPNSTAGWFDAQSVSNVHVNIH